MALELDESLQNVQAVHLAEALAGRDHRPDVFFRLDVEVDDAGLLLSEHALEGLGDGGFLLHSDADGAHGVGDGRIVGVLKIAARVAPAIEQLLPLADHAHVAVVYQADLDRQFMLHGGRQFGQRHVEAVIAVDVDDGGVRLGDLSADGGRQAKAHRTQPAGGDELAGPGEFVELGGPHLVLPHAGGDDGVVVRLSAQFLDDLLRLDLVGVAVVAEGEFLLPLGDFSKPLLALAMLDLLCQRAEDMLGVADDGNIDVDVLGDAGRVDVDMNDLGVGCERGQLAGDAVVEAGPDGDEVIILLSGMVMMNQENQSVPVFICIN